MSENSTVAGQLKEVMVKQQARIFGLRQTETKLQNKIIKLHQENKELMTLNNQLKSFEASMIQTQEENYKLEKEIKKLNLELFDLRKASTYYKKKITELRVENQNLDIKNEKLTAQLDKLREDYTELDNEATELRKSEW